MSKLRSQIDTQTNRNATPYREDDFETFPILFEILSRYAELSEVFSNVTKAYLEKYVFTYQETETIRSCHRSPRHCDIMQRWRGVGAYTAELRSKTEHCPYGKMGGELTDRWRRNGDRGCRRERQSGGQRLTIALLMLRLKFVLPGIVRK